MRIVSLVLVLTAAIGLALLSGCRAKNTANDNSYAIGAVFDITGTGSPLGTPEKETAEMVAKQINDAGGINGHPLKLIVLDNASDEAKSVTAMKRLIESDEVLAIIGPSQTGTTLSGAATVEAAKVPLVSCAAGVKIVDPVNPWIFKTAQSDVYAAAKVIDYLKAKKLMKVAVISVANAFGQSGLEQLKKQAPPAGITLVAEESFQPTDTDMTTQIMKIRGTPAQAVICWGTNPGPAIVAKNMQSLGVKLPLVMSHGVANKKFIELAGSAANGVVFPAGKLLIAESIPKSEAQRSVLLKYAEDFKQTYSKDADTFGGHAYDALQLVVEALKAVGPDRQKIRDYLETATFTGISGNFKFSAKDHNGLIKDAFAMVKIVDGKWVPEK